MSLCRMQLSSLCNLCVCLGLTHLSIQLKSKVAKIDRLQHFKVAKQFLENKPQSVADLRRADVSLPTKV